MFRASGRELWHGAQDRLCGSSSWCTGGSRSEISGLVMKELVFPVEPTT